MEGSFVKFYAKIHSFTQVPTTKVNNIEKVQHSLGPFSIKSPAIKFWVYVHKAQSIKLDTSLQNWEKFSPTTHTQPLFFLDLVLVAHWVLVHYWGSVRGHQIAEFEIYSHEWVSEWMLGWWGSGSVVWCCGVGFTRDCKSHHFNNFYTFTSSFTRKL